MPLGEADRILTLFTPDVGKVRAVGKGVRRTKSRYGGHLELLNRVEVSISYGRSLDVVNEAQVIESFPALREDLQQLSKAFYLAELVDGFTAEQSQNEPVYRILLRAFRSLDSARQPDLLVRHFEMHLLGHSGYSPQLYRCVECRKTLTPGQHRFSPAVGGTLCPDCRPEGVHVRSLSLRALKVLRLLDRGQLPAIVSMKLDPALAAELDSLTGGAVKYWLEREIRSKSFVEQLQSESHRKVYT